MIKIKDNDGLTCYFLKDGTARDYSRSTRAKDILEVIYGELDSIVGLHRRICCRYRHACVYAYPAWYRRGRLRLGCHVFSSSKTRRIRKWAERVTR
jgi:hypothetical protein